VVVTEAFSNDIKTKFSISEDKIHIVENGIETNQFLPMECGYIRDQLGINGKFVVSYIGTMGFAHGLDKVIETAQNIGKETSDIIFLIIGEGANKEKLKRQIAESGINNVMVIDQKPRSEIPSYINASDAMLVTLRKDDVFKTVIPSKMLEFMACGKPVILGVDGQARKILEASGGGYYVEPDNHRDLAAAIRKLHKDPAGRKKMGENGRRHVLKHFDRRQKAKEYLDILQKVIHDE
jgi:glycosyltransferase involved in cell wall biosynthesis